MRSTWTDSRLDDLNDRVKDLGAEVRGLRGEMGALKRTLIQVGGGMAATMLVGFMGLIATQL